MFYQILNTKNKIKSIFSIVFYRKMNTKIKDFDLIVQKTIEYMSKNNLSDLKGSPRNKFECWQLIVRSIYNSLSDSDIFRKSSRICNAWKRNTSSYKTVVIESINIKNQSKIEIQFNTLESNHILEKFLSNTSKTRLLLGFTNILSDKMQRSGIKCWLKCRSNYFLKGNNKNWVGKYGCVDSNCSLIYNASGTFNSQNVILNVSWNGIIPSHEKLSPKLRISGEKRKKQALTLMADGINATRSNNILFNSKNDEISKYLKETLKIRTCVVINLIKLVSFFKSK